MIGVVPYLTPDEPRWAPTDEAAITAAATAGLLVESHYLELKSTIPPGKGEIRELARDLASFAIDGLTLLIGLDESDDGGPPKPNPIELAGLAERVELVARTIPDPPIPVTCTPIASSEPGRGFLLIEIPATGTAPHMVGGAYMGRGDKTKIRLSDPEVIRLHQARTHTQDLAGQLLDTYVARDPIRGSQQAHGFTIAAPLRPRPEMLLDARSTGGWRELLTSLSSNYGTPDVRGADYVPSLAWATSFARRADGAALTYNLTELRQPEHLDPSQPEADIIELEATEDGTIRVMTTRLGDDANDGRGQVVFENVLATPHTSDHRGRRGSRRHHRLRRAMGTRRRRNGHRREACGRGWPSKTISARHLRERHVGVPAPHRSFHGRAPPDSWRGHEPPRRPVPAQYRLRHPP